jgi:hypothetical protein
MRIALLLAVACGEPRTGPPPTPEQRVQLRADMIAKVAPFAGRAEYAVTDDDLVDPCVTEALQLTQGRMPEADERSRVIDDGVRCMSWKLDSPDGLDRISKRIAARYAHPVTTRAGDTVTVDVGVIAAPLRYSKGHHYLASSPAYDRSEWATAEVVRVLHDAMQAQPDAKHYAARVDLLDDVWTYTYDRTLDRITVERAKIPDRYYASVPVGGDPGHIRSLYTFDLTEMHR